MDIFPSLKRKSPMKNCFSFAFACTVPGNFRNILLYTFYMYNKQQTLWTMIPRAAPTEYSGIGFFFASAFLHCYVFTTGIAFNDVPFCYVQ